MKTDHFCIVISVLSWSPSVFTVLLLPGFSSPAALNKGWKVSDPWPQSCVHNFLICQHLLIRGDPGAQCKLGFDKVFGSIMARLIIYNILCILRHAYISRSLLHASSSCVSYSNETGAVCLYFTISLHLFQRMPLANKIILPRFLVIVRPKALTWAIAMWKFGKTRSQNDLKSVIGQDGCCIIEDYFCFW